MINNIIVWLRKRQLLRRWRHARNPNGIRLNIGNIKELFQEFDNRNIDHVVLQGCSNMEYMPEEEFFICGDEIDILVNTDDLNLLASIATKNHGNIKCNIYNLTGRRGMSFLNIPYYPPALAEVILAKKRKYCNVFNMSEPMIYFRSLIYHLVYHKGLDSGIKSGCHLESSPKFECYCYDFLEKLGQRLNAEIQQPYTLLGLHQYLEKVEWDMPYDLIERWPKKTDWHQFLLEKHTEKLEPWANKLPGLLVFFVRQNHQYSDIHTSTKMICQMLEEKFSVLKVIDLNSEQMKSVLKKVRGGNWLVHKGTWVSPPQVAVICYDHNPLAVQKTDTDIISDYPTVNNKNVFHKHNIRTRLEKLNNFNKTIHLHGSDNACDAQNMLFAIYAQKALEINQEIFESIQKK